MELIIVISFRQKLYLNFYHLSNFNLCAFQDEYKNSVCVCVDVNYM